MTAAAPHHETDEALAEQCAQAVDRAERELLARYMPAIYWYPQKAFGAKEEELAGFLLFALERIREREIFGKFDPGRGVRFSTWFGTVLRNLYLDFRRATPIMPTPLSLEAEQLTPPEIARREVEVPLLEALHLRCRTLFKLLLLNAYALTGEEITWIAETSGRDLLAVSEALASLELDLADQEVALSERYDHLARAWWRTRSSESALQRGEQTDEHPFTNPSETQRRLTERHARNRCEYRRLQHDLGGIAGIATLPYRDLAKLLAMPEGTLASHISRCRAQATVFLRQLEKETP